jgi:glucose/arabinose dehydrogenase
VNGVFGRGWWAGLACAVAVAGLLTGCSGGSPGGSGTPPPWLSRTSSAPSATGTRGPGTSSASPTPTGPAAAPPPAKGTATVTATLATGLRAPWGVAELPDGDLLVGLRDSGKIVRVHVPAGSRGPGTVSQVGQVPGAVHTGEEDGLLGLALSPGFGADHTVFAYFSTDSDNRVARMLYDPTKPAGEQLGAPNVILRGIPRGDIHNGGRIAFGPDGMLYVTTGETGRGTLAQDRSSLAGKILRMRPDGSAAPGNPFPHSLVWSYGHRNVQGLAWDSQGRLWASEFGQDTWDELNLIKPGRNYGWPVVEGIAHRSGYTDPVAEWHPSQASPSGLAVVDGSVWLAGLRGERLWRVPIGADGRPSASPQPLLKGRYGRLRTVLALDGGGLLVTTSNTDGRGKPAHGDDRVLRLTVS